MNCTHLEELALDAAARAAENHINPWDEPIESGLLSSCCQAGLKYVYKDHGTCPETGYRDIEDRTICVQCGDESEPLVEALPARKPAKYVPAQGDLFQEVA